MNPHLVFDRFEHLWLALYHWDGAGAGSLPSKVLRLEQGGWAVPLSALGANPEQAQSEFEHICRQCGWTLTLQNENPVHVAELIRFEDVVIGPWQYVDTLRERTPAEPLPPAGCFNPAGASVPLVYLLAATTPDQSQQIYSGLSGALASGMTAVPVRLVGDSRPAPYPFFWRVECGLRLPQVTASARVAHQPPTLSVLRTAARVWWGPLGNPNHNGTSIYFEWPYTNRLPIELLRDACAGRGEMVLLSPNPPYQLQLHTPPGAPFFRELVEAFDLEPPRQSHTASLEPSATHSADADAFRFPLRLKLARRTGRHALEEQIRQLELRLAGLVVFRDRLQALVSRSRDPDSIFFEPLLVYLEPAGRIPRQLRRLLVEWAGQDQDLGALRYLRLDGADVPEWLIPADGPIHAHVLTTSRALQVPASLHFEEGRGLGVRLRDYLPHAGAHVRFELLQQWAEFGLRLFVPMDQQLELYPEMPPNEVAARQLAAALLVACASPDPALHPEWCAALSEAPDGQLRCLRLPVNRFRSFATAFDWDCSLNLLPAHGSYANPSAVTVAATAFAAQVAADFESHAIPVANAELARRQADFIAESQRLDAEFDRRHAAAMKILGVLQLIESGTTRVAERLQQTSAAHQALIHDLAATAPTNAGLSAALAGLRDEHEKLAAVRTELAEVKGELERLKAPPEGPPPPANRLTS